MASIDPGAYDTDKSPASLANYERECGHLFSEPISLLELGVQRGGSLLLWRDLLPHARIAGLDLNPVHLDDPTGRIYVHRGAQQDGAALDEVAAAVAPEGFDIVIDDASHVGIFTARSFTHLFSRHLKPGGVYVIEDWGTGYWPRWTDGHAFRGSPLRLEAPESTDGAPAAPRPSRIESIRRRIRSASRPLGMRLARRHPALKDRLETVYMRLEGASLPTRFPSHDYGMVGFVKQLVDACAIDAGDGSAGGARHGGTKPQIDSVHVYPSQVFVHKAD